MANKSMSPGCIVGAVIAGFFVVSAAILVVVFGLGWFYYQRQGIPTANPSPVTSSPASSAPGGPVATPEPTPEQVRALEGGKTITWASQGMSWTVPERWSLQQESEIYSVKSPGSWDAGWLIVNVSSMPGAFPADASIQAMYDAEVEAIKLGQNESARWLELDGIRGVEHLEAAPSDPSDIRRLQWRGYRTYNGQTQLVSIMMKSSGKGFPEHAAALYAILYSSKVSK